jgi:hypothetical protein
MEMTRRGFLDKFLKLGTAALIGAWCFVKKADPRRFVRAGRAVYPGKIKKLPKVFGQSKWRG